MTSWHPTVRVWVGEGAIIRWGEVVWAQVVDANSDWEAVRPCSVHVFLRCSVSWFAFFGRSFVRCWWDFFQFSFSFSFSDLSVRLHQYRCHLWVCVLWLCCCVPMLSNDLCLQWDPWKRSSCLRGLGYPHVKIDSILAGMDVHLHSQDIVSWGTHARALSGLYDHM
jgi:hypothetical protein